MELIQDTELHSLVASISLIHFKKPYEAEVVFNSRLRTTGGRYIPGKRLIELNPKYYLESSEEEFIGIIKHELCHYHLHNENKPFGHGDQEFKDLLLATGSPRFCKPIPSQMKEPYLYKCERCSMVYTRKRKVDIKRYSCGKCRGKLELHNSFEL